MEVIMALSTKKPKKEGGLLQSTQMAFTSNLISSNLQRSIKTIITLDSNLRHLYLNRSKNTIF